MGAIDRADGAESRRAAVDHERLLGDGVVAAPPNARAHEVAMLNLQRSAGNAAVADLLRSRHSSGAANDVAETSPVQRTAGLAGRAATRTLLAMRPALHRPPAALSSLGAGGSRAFGARVGGALLGVGPGAQTAPPRGGSPGGLLPAQVPGRSGPLALRPPGQLTGRNDAPGRAKAGTGGPDWDYFRERAQEANEETTLTVVQDAGVALESVWIPLPDLRTLQLTVEQLQAIADFAMALRLALLAASRFTNFGQAFTAIVTIGRVLSSIDGSPTRRQTIEILEAVLTIAGLVPHPTLQAAAKAAGAALAALKAMTEADLVGPAPKTGGAGAGAAVTESNRVTAAAAAIDVGEYLHDLPGSRSPLGAAAKGLAPLSKFLSLGTAFGVGERRNTAGATSPQRSSRLAGSRPAALSTHRQMPMRPASFNHHRGVPEVAPMRRRLLLSAVGLLGAWSSSSPSARIRGLSRSEKKAIDGFPRAVAEAALQGRPGTNSQLTAGALENVRRLVETTAGTQPTIGDSIELLVAIRAVTERLDHPDLLRCGVTVSMAIDRLRATASAGAVSRAMAPAGVAAAPPD